MLLCTCIVMHHNVWLSKSSCASPIVMSWLGRQPSKQSFKHELPCFYRWKFDIKMHCVNVVKSMSISKERSQDSGQVRFFSVIALCFFIMVQSPQLHFHQCSSRAWHIRKFSLARLSKFAFFSTDYIDGLVQDCSISIANTLEILQSYTKPTIHDLEENFAQINLLTGSLLALGRRARRYVEPCHVTFTNRDLSCGSKDRQIWADRHWSFWPQVEKCRKFHQEQNFLQSK